jgi:hypothetical protein
VKNRSAGVGLVIWDEHDGTADVAAGRARRRALIASPRPGRAKKHAGLQDKWGKGEKRSGAYVKLAGDGEGPPGEGRDSIPRARAIGANPSAEVYCLRSCLGVCSIGSADQGLVKQVIERGKRFI